MILFKRKLRTLQRIMNSQCKHFKRCKQISCLISGDYIIIKKHSIHGENHDIEIKIPKTDISKVIIRERAKLYIYNKSQSIEDANKEIENIKD
jgi:hypothetical protein